MARISDEILLGRRVEDDPDGFGTAGEEITVNRELLKEGHIHLRGRTRSGKTSLAIAPMACQLMRQYETFDDEHGERQIANRDAIFVFDLGGDLALFNTLREKAVQNGRRFRFISLDPRDDWDYFDPFQCVSSDNEIESDDRIIRICNLLVQAFHLDFGLVYGGSYYAQRNLNALLRVARRLQSTNRTGQSLGLEDIAFWLERNAERDEEQIRMTFQFLLEYEQLKPPVDATNTIDMQRALDEGEIIYFLCPTMGEATTARQIAGLGLYTLLNAAMERSRLGKTPKHAWVFTDEFQELAGRSFAALLAQSSKFGISMVMANQTTTQLQNRDLDLSDIVRDNTLAKLYFTVTGEKDVQDLQAFSKDDRLELRSQSISASGPRQGVSETIVPLLRKDTILDTSATHRHAFLLLDDGHGHREPTRIVSEYAIDSANYRIMKHTPPPRLVGVREVPPPRIDKVAPPWKTAAKTSLSELLASLLNQKRLLEQPTLAA